MLHTEMTISFHGQNAAIIVAEPAGKGWNVHARLDNRCGEKMPEIVVSNAMDPGRRTSGIDSFLTFSDTKDWIVRAKERLLVRSLLSNSLPAFNQFLKERLQRWEERNITVRGFCFVPRKMN